MWPQQVVVRGAVGDRGDDVVDFAWRERWVSCGEEGVVGMPRDGCAVLVVDDDRINRGLLCRLLEQEGYRARIAVDGREALAALGEERFDAVLLDIVMPEVDGMEVLRTLKGDVRLWHIPVIMISGVEDTESIVACLELGADDYVQKPFDPVVLRARLNACLARRQFHELEVEYQKMVQEQAAELQDLRREVSGADGADTVPNDGDPGARRAQVAVMTVGLGGLHDFAGEADPAAVVAVVDAFQAAVGELAVRFGGAVSARSADAVTVVFGGVRACSDPAVAGLRMAVALDGEMATLVSGSLGGHGAVPTWAAGLAVGDACVGVVGGGARSMAVVGPVVDRAGRLREVGPGAVLLDEGAFSAAQRLGDVEGVEAELEELAGGASTPVYRLRRRLPGAGDDAPSRPGPTTAG